MKVYKEDIRSNYSDNGINLMDLGPVNDVMGAINSQTANEDTFSGFRSAIYELENLDFGALKVTKTASNTVDNTIAVNFTIRSTYISAKDLAYDYEIKRTVSVSRE